MKLDFLTKNYKVSNRLEEVLQRKLDRLDKYFDSEPTAKVVLSDNGKGCKMELSVAGSDIMVRSEAVCDTMYYCIDNCMPKLERQIVKLHSRRQDKKHVDADYMYVAEVDTALVPITRVKKFDISSMTPEDAAQQLDVVDHDFYMFVNVYTGNVELVYRRRDGDAGHLVPKL